MLKAAKSSSGVTRTMIWMLIVGYGVFLVGRSTYQNYAINKDIDAQTQILSEQEKKQRVLQLSLFYYQSKSFREIEARRRLNLKAKDEKVALLPHATTEPLLSIVSSSYIQASKPPARSPMQAWWHLFFGPQ